MNIGGMGFIYIWARDEYWRYGIYVQMARDEYWRYGIYVQMGEV
jgi:hypothetical protein